MTELLEESADQAGPTGRSAIQAEPAVGPINEARRATIDAGLAALKGRSDEALALYREALRGWRDVSSVWDELLSGIDMATLLDPAEPEVAAVVASTRTILERLRARPYLEKLDAAVARTPRGTTQAARVPARPEVAVTD